MKKTLLLFFLFLIVSLTIFIDSFGQITKCGTQSIPIPASLLDSLNNLSGTIRRGSSVTVPIKINIIRQTNSSGGISYSNIQNQIDVANQQYSASGIEFVECGPVNYINNSSLYSFQRPSDESTLLNYNTLNVINIFYAETVSFNGVDFDGGFSFFPWMTAPAFPTPQNHYVIIAESNAYDNSTLAHELGHYFGLYHTHETATGIEYVNGTNCSTAGDLLCDTPADPNCYNCVNITCQYITSSTCPSTDPLNSPYSPPTTNIMSYSRQSCAQNFSNQQNSRMNNVYQNLRSFLQCQTTSLPPNDNCSGASLLSSSTSCNYLNNQTVNNATASGKPKGSCDVYTGTSALADVWYYFVAQSTGHTITVDPNSSQLDAVIVAYSSCNSNPIGCSDILGGNGVLSTLNLSGLTVGETYYIRVYDYGLQTADGGFRICVTHTTQSCIPVSIASQPTDQTASVGGTTSFTISANGTPPFKYFWYKNGVLQTPSPPDIFSISNTYQTPILAAGDNGNDYYCIITNCTNTYQAQSATAYLTINNCSSIAQPGIISGSTSVCQGTSQTYSINPVTGATNYYWSYNGNNLNGNTSVTFNPTTNGTLSVMANNSCGNSNPSTLAVSVIQAPLEPGIISGNSNVCQGSSQTYSINAVSGATSYTWSYSGGGNPIGTGASITFSPINSGILSVAANSSCGSSNLRTFSITVNPPLTPAISILQISCIGSTVSFNATITNGGNNPQYLWAVVNTSITGTGSTFTVYNATDGMQIQCRLTSNANCVNPVQINSNTLLITIPNVSISGNLIFCQNSPTTLTASGANNYQWNTGQNTSSIKVSTAGLFTVIGTSNGCKDTAKVTTTVLPIPSINLASNISVPQGERIRLGGMPVATGIDPLSYKWAPNYAMDFDTVENPIVRPNFSTAYTLKVTDKNGCSETKSVYVIVTGFFVYPTPTNDIINIYGSNIETGRYTFLLRNALGQVVLTKRFEIQTNIINEQMSIGGLSNGIYFLSIESSALPLGLPSAFKIIKQ